MKQKPLFFILCCLAILAGCSSESANSTDNAINLTNEMQLNVDNANTLINQQSVIDKSVTSSDPNTRDKAAIQKALGDLDKATKQQIPTYQTAIKKVQSGMSPFLSKVEKLDDGDVKQLAKNAMSSFQTMTNQELTYANQAKSYIQLQTVFFTVLQSGKEPTNAQIDQLNKEADKYSKEIDLMNVKIDEFNKAWEQLAKKAGVKMQ